MTAAATQILALVINLENDYVFDSTWKGLERKLYGKGDYSATKDLTLQWGESVGKKMGYGNWNMWLLKLVWVARNNFACEVYVYPFSEKHVKEVNFYFKDKNFS